MKVSNIGKLQFKTKTLNEMSIGEFGVVIDKEKFYNDYFAIRYPEGALFINEETSVWTTLSISKYSVRPLTKDESFTFKGN